MSGRFAFALQIARYKYMASQRQVVVSGGFDDIKSRDLRFLEEAARLGELTVLLWPDDVLRNFTGKTAKFSLAERLYFLNAVRYVRRVIEADAAADFNSLPEAVHADVWADYEPTVNQAREQCATKRKIAYRCFQGGRIERFPRIASRCRPTQTARKLS